VGEAEVNGVLAKELELAEAAAASVELSPALVPGMEDVLVVGKDGDASVLSVVNDDACVEDSVDEDVGDAIVFGVLEFGVFVVDLSAELEDFGLGGLDC